MCVTFAFWIQCLPFIWFIDFVSHILTFLCYSLTSLIFPYVCVCVCLFCNLDGLQSHAFIAVHFISYIDCFYFTHFPKLAFEMTHVHLCVCVCECIVVFCTTDVLESHPFTVVCFFSGLWLICRLYAQKNSVFSYFCQFPIHFLWPVILTRRPWVWLFFLRPLRLFKSCPQFFCVFIYQVP